MKENNQINIVNNKTPDSVESKAEFFSGPMPHPAIIDKYERIYPGAAEIIFKKFQEQTEHRIAIEKKVIDTTATKELLGLVFGFVVVMSAIGGGIYCAKIGQPFLGGGLSLSGLAMLVLAFVSSRETVQDEERAKE